MSRWRKIWLAEGATRMRRIGCAGAVLWVAVSMQAQRTDRGAEVRSESDPVLSQGAGPVIVSPKFAQVLVRFVDDPLTGQTWLLFKDASGGPGRLVLSKEMVEKKSLGTPGLQVPPLIRAGDKVTVEQHTDRVDVHLEAVALQAAKAGERLDVRLEIGRRVVHAFATAPGKAALMVPGGTGE